MKDTGIIHSRIGFERHRIAHPSTSKTKRIAMCSFRRLRRISLQLPAFQDFFAATRNNLAVLKCSQMFQKRRRQDFKKFWATTLPCCLGPARENKSAVPQKCLISRRLRLVLSPSLTTSFFPSPLTPFRLPIACQTFSVPCAGWPSSLSCPSPCRLSLFSPPC